MTERLRTLIQLKIMVIMIMEIIFLHLYSLCINPPEESADQEATKPPPDTLWSARKTTASLLDPDWMVPGEVVPQYWPITGEPGEPPLKMVTESQPH